MFGIIESYNEIEKKFDLDKGIDGLLVAEEFAQIWYENTQGLLPKSVIIFGAGGNTNILLNMLVKWNEEEKIAFIIDNNPSVKALYGIPVIRIDEFMLSGIELIWISSWKYGAEMKNQAMRIFSDIRCINPYDLLQVRLPQIDISDIANYVYYNKYLWFSNKLIERDNAKDMKVITRISQDLIAGYYKIKDWISLEREIDYYIKNKMENYSKYLSLKKEVGVFLEEIEKAIRNRKQRCFIVFIIDSLSKYITERMPKLKGLKKDSLYYTEYRNEYPTTHEFFLSMLTGWRPFEDETYMEKLVEPDSSVLLKHLHEHNIRIKMLGPNSKIIKDFRLINQYKTKMEENSIISEVFFNAINEMCNDESEQLIIIHTDVTIHSPHFSPITRFKPYSQTDDAKSAFYSYFNTAVLYTDELLSFYNCLFRENENNTQIVMGDHGINVDLEYSCRIAKKQFENKGAQWNKPMISPELIICNAGNGKGAVEDLISANQFVDILFSVIRGENPQNQKMNKDVIPIEIVPGYDIPWLKLGKESHNYYLPIGGAGCMNKEFIYINLENGEELYYRIVDDRIMQIKDSHEIQSVSEILGKNNITENKFKKTILRKDFFDNHNKLYQSDIPW